MTKKRKEADGHGFRTWLQFPDDASHADMVVHKHGVSNAKKKVHRLPGTKSPASKSDLPLLGEKELSAGTMRVQEQLLDDETRPFQVELTNLLDVVQETETKMVEMLASESSLIKACPSTSSAD